MNTRVVPVEPTGAMIAAALRACRPLIDHDDISFQSIVDIYQAMLAAAPPPPEPACDCAASRVLHEKTCASLRSTNAAATQPEPDDYNDIGKPRPATPGTHLRKQIADAKARQAKGEGIPGDAELAHYDDKAPERRIAQRRVESERDTKRPLPARRQGWKTDRRQNAAVESPVPAAPYYEHATTCPTYSGSTLCDCRPVPAAPTTLNLGAESKLPLSAEQIEHLLPGPSTRSDVNPITILCFQALRAIDLDAKCRMVFEQHDGTKLSAYELCNLKLRAVELERQVAEADTALESAVKHGLRWKDKFKKAEAELAELKARVK